MSLLASDPILGPSRDTPANAIAYLDGPDQNDKDYVQAVYKYALIAGVDAAFVIVQWLHETGDATSIRWTRDKNAAGIFIPADSTPQPFVIANADEAARIHVQCLYSIVKGSFHPKIALPPASESMMRSRWLGRMQDPAWPTVRVVGDLNHRWVDRTGDPQSTWAWDDKYIDKLLAKARAVFPNLGNADTPQPSPGGTTPMPELNLTKSLIKGPNEIRDIINVSQRDQSNSCRGYDNLGFRPIIPEFLILHRPQSPRNASISGYFHQRCCPALTDLECSSITGQFRRFVERGNAPSGWANGVVSSPYGDALKYLDHFGWDTNRVNRNGEAVEVSGWFAQPGTNVTQEDPISEECWQSLALWVASRAHDYGIHWDVFPLIPAENNRSYITWHQEWTIGTGKVCPGRTLMDGTARLVELARAIMKEAQTGTVAPEPPKYAPLSVPDFLTPRWINGGEDAKLGKTKVYSCRRRWTAAKPTPRLQQTAPGAPEVGPDLKKGESFVGIGAYRSNDKWWILAEFGERVSMDAMTDRVTFGTPKAA